MVFIQPINHFYSLKQVTVNIKKNTGKLMFTVTYKLFYSLKQVTANISSIVISVIYYLMLNIGKLL